MPKKAICFLLFTFVLIGAVFAQYGAPDPSTRSPNARIIGLGRAFAALADDSGAIYFNPAGIAQETGWQFSSMSGKFMDAYSYLSFTGYYATNIGVIGIGYGGYNIGGAYCTTIEAGSNPNDPIYIIDTTQPQVSNYNNALILDYANSADKIFGSIYNPGWLDKIDLGINVKIFSAGLAGDHITNGAAAGNEIDAGLLIKPAPFAHIALVAQNLLPSSLGGKLTYVNGHSEVYPAMLKVGTMFKVFGDETAFRSFAGQDLSLMLDFDRYISVPSEPLVYHLGAEWKPISLLSLRAGYDQTAGDDGTGKIVAAGTPTYGIGFEYAGFRFDYAYHQLPGIAIDSSYFSLSYSPTGLKKHPKKEFVKISNPPDKTETYDKGARVKGQVVDLKVKLVEVNDNKIVVQKTGTFDVDVPLVVGKNTIAVKAFGERGKLEAPLNVTNIRVLRLAVFPDVSQGFWAKRPISLISMLNIVTGYPDGSFKPEGNITRAEMAALLMRAGKPPILLTKKAPAFSDVSQKFWAEKYINDAASYGVVEGYSNGTFKPKGNITRAEGLAMIARFAAIQQEPYKLQYFPDIKATYWAAPIIAGSAKAGLLEYLKGKPFEPKKKMTRAEAVEILSRTGFVNSLLSKDLMNWERY